MAMAGALQVRAPLTRTGPVPVPRVVLTSKAISSRFSASFTHTEGGPVVLIGAATILGALQAQARFRGRRRRVARRVSNFMGYSMRPGEGSEDERVDGRIGSFSWYDPTSAAASLIRMRTAVPEWALSRAAAAAARTGTVWRGNEIGVDWDTEVKKLDNVQSELEECYAEVVNPVTEYPLYFIEPFHAYDDGNLSWIAAKEYESAALTVFADLFSDTPVINGDPQFRDTFHQATKAAYKDFFSSEMNPKVIVDIGCGVGISTRRLAMDFPDAQVTGMDLSPHFLAIAQYRLKESPLPNVKFVHRQGENTGLPDSSVDLVTLTTVLHELPWSAAKAVFTEARRILKPNGALSFVDMDPTETFMKYLDGYGGLFKAGIRATEPHLIEYCTIDFDALLKDCGFNSVKRTRTTTRHCVHTAATADSTNLDEGSAGGSDGVSSAESGGDLFLFACLDPIRRNILNEESEVFEYKAGNNIINEGAHDKCIYELLSGTIQGRHGFTTMFSSSSPGAVFGEGNFLAGEARARNMNIVAATDCKVRKIVPATMDRLLSSSEILRIKVLAANRNALTVEDYSQIPQRPADASKEQSEALFKDKPVKTFPSGSSIVKEGSVGDHIYVVKSGECYAVKDGARLMAYCVGDYFGEKAVLGNTVRAASVIAESDVDAWEITKDEFNEIRSKAYELNATTWH